VWFKRKAPDTARETHQRICIDGLSKSVTIYWMAVPGNLRSQTFRDVPGMEEWFELGLQTVVQR
jgi:hypothetical protein